LELTALLDTHVFLWAIASPTRLSPTAFALIENSETELLVSAVTAWEIATKYRLGRLPEAERVVAGYDAHLAMLGARELAVASNHALKAGIFALEHRDPFDRMLAAQAICEGVVLISNDQVFGRFPDLSTQW
jgi:PIN domain nuclease of toxin-antitoxin system